jgi:hypothetical protein
MNFLPNTWQVLRGKKRFEEGKYSSSSELPVISEEDEPEDESEENESDESEMGHYSGVSLVFAPQYIRPWPLVLYHLPIPTIS